MQNVTSILCILIRLIEIVHFDSYFVKVRYGRVFFIALRIHQNYMFYVLPHSFIYSTMLTTGPTYISDNYHAVINVKDS